MMRWKLHIVLVSLKDEKTQLWSLRSSSTISSTHESLDEHWRCVYQGMNQNSVLDSLPKDIKPSSSGCPQEQT
jgi:hypothetical protein